MYQSTSQFIAAARTLKTALLTSLLVNESLRIETGGAGSVPCVIDKPNRIILNGHYALQMVPADAPEPGERFLQRQIIGGRIPVITNYDSAEAQAKVVGRECVMLDIRSDSVPMLPYSTRERAGMSVSVSLPPDAVVELLNYVMEGPEFEDSRFFALRAAAGTGFRTGAHFKDDIYALVRSTQPGTEEQTARLKAGFDASFGLGVSSYAMRGLLAICCGDAAVRGCTEFAKEDVLRLVEASFAHRIQFEDAAPGVKRQALSALPKIAEWIVNG